MLRYDALQEGARQRIAELQGEGVAIAVADALSNSDLLALAEACAELPLVTAGSGVALGLSPAYQRRGWFEPSASAAQLAAVAGPAAIVSGSCSQATNTQVQRWLASGRPGIALDPLALHHGEQSVEQLREQALAALASAPVLVYATSGPERVQVIQKALGAEAAGALVEFALAALAAGLVRAGVRRLVVAGGETSGAVVQALGVQQLRIGPPICPGVPWTEARLSSGGDALLLALKSGNFGGPDFFAQALREVGVEL